jgi:hypothetical protein
MPGDTFGWLQVLTQTGSFGLIVYGVVRLLPQVGIKILDAYERLVDTFREEIEAERVRCDERSVQIEHSVAELKASLDVALARNTDAIERNTQAMAMLERHFKGTSGD